MNVTGVDFITVPTRDFEKASEFYGGVLGLPLSVRWGGLPIVPMDQVAGYEPAAGQCPYASMRCIPGGG